MDGMNERSADADAVDWADRYRAGDTPWDIGGPHPELSIRLQDGRLAPPEPGESRALVPGAGRGHDAIALARRGWQVTALDVVPSLAAEMGAELERLGGEYVVGDALRLEGEPFDLVWDHTFFCAIDPGSRAPWGQRVRDLVVPGGRYTALVFPVGKPAEEGGPPHGMSPDDVLEVLGASFVEVERAAVSRAVSKRRWREHWLVAERRALVVQP